jgi:hypothetical protein
MKTKRKAFILSALFAVVVFVLAFKFQKLWVAADRDTGDSLDAPSITRFNGDENSHRVQKPISKDGKPSEISDSLSKEVVAEDIFTGALSKRFQLNPAAVSDLLTDNQIQSLAVTIEKLKNDIKLVEQDFLTIMEEGNVTTVFKISAFWENKGREIREHFVSSLLNILGSDRSSKFLEANAKELLYLTGDFGKYNRYCKVSINSDQTVQAKFEFDIMIVDPNSGFAIDTPAIFEKAKHSALESRHFTFNELPAQYGHLFQEFKN